MRRGYSINDYRQSVSLIRALVPEAAITTDIIVGFPGETSAEFEQGYKICQKLGFARTHVFPYSPREGTQASHMLKQVEDRVRKQRSQQMLALAKESAQNFIRQFLDKIMPVLWENGSDGIWSGLTDNYIKVYTKSTDDLTNKLLLVKLGKLFHQDGVWGERVNN
jgi:threonylcarbamoyladenosine tRNA methylthiotransferase MtaB